LFVCLFVCMPLIGFSLFLFSLPLGQLHNWGSDFFAPRKNITLSEVNYFFKFEQHFLILYSAQFNKEVLCSSYLLGFLKFFYRLHFTFLFNLIATFL
jgi:hypothetical protein